MKLTSKFSPLLSTKFITLVVLCFLIPLVDSLLIGTRSFNSYCAQALRGDWSGSLARFGPEHSGFQGCILNTPTLNPYIFMIALYGAVFLLHTFLVSQLEEKNCLKNLVQIFLICLLFNFLYYAFSSFFQRIEYGFLEGGVSVTSGRRWLVSFFGIKTMYIPKLIFWLLLTFLISQAGLIIMTFLLNKFKLSYGYKPGIKSFLYVFVGASLFQLLTLVIAFSIFSFIIRITSHRPVVHQFPQSPRQVFSLGDQQSRDTAWKKYQNEKHR